MTLISTTIGQGACREKGTVCRVACFTAVALSAGLMSATATADADSDWMARSTGPGVVMATGFDTAAEVEEDTFPDSTADHVSWEQSNMASGNGSLRMDILKTDSTSSGSWVRYLADDEREFGPNETFYVQFRQYLPRYFATHVFSGNQFGGPHGGGWKQMIISNKRGSNQLFEVVLQNTSHRGLVQGYSRNSEGGYLGWEDSISTPCSGADFVYQNQIDRGFGTDTCLDARRTYGGLYSYGANTGVPDPETGAFIYYPDEWLTFLVKVSPGTFGGGPSVKDSNIQVWAARESDTSYTFLVDKMVNLGRATDSSGTPYYFDAVWLLPYHTEKTADPTAENTYTLYDELIVSTSFIPAPNSAPIGAGPRPKPPTNVHAN